MYSIGQVAEMFGLPISTLRYYDKQGLFPNMERVSGIRKFGDTEIESLRVIECLKKAGMEIKDIRQFMDWCVEGPSTTPRNRPFPQNAGKLQKMLQFSHEKGRFPIDRLVIIGV